MTFYGIYKITNLLNGKMYIGQHKTDNLDDGYMGSGTILKRAIKKYGVENFRKEWIMFCEDAEDLNYWERVFVDETWVLRSDTYNLRTGGEQCCVFSEETLKVMSEKSKGRKHTTESKKKISVANTGKHPSLEARRKMSKAKKGMYDGEKHPRYGTHCSEETKRKLSKALTGRKMPDGVGERHSKWLKEHNPFKGKHHSEETKQKLRECAIGRSATKETREKLSKVAKGSRWYNNGIVSRMIKPNEPIPEGFVAGRLKKDLTTKQ